MAEYVNPGIVTVPAGQNVPMVSTAACGKPCIVHREGSGLVTLRGLTQQCKARFKVSFGANIAVPTGGTVGAITTALAVNGEALNGATATVTRLRWKTILTSTSAPLWKCRVVAA